MIDFLKMSFLMFQKKNWSEDFEFCLAYRQGDRLTVADPIAWRTLEPNQTIMQPTFEMCRSEMQELFNKLWAEGFRPADGTGNSGHIAAITNHLEDMRTLVFKRGVS